MQRRWLKVLTVVAIAAGAASACDRPTAPITAQGSAPVTPQLSVTSGGYFIGGWKLLQGSRLAMQTRLDVIDEHGGKINIGASSLSIPSGAVSGPTLFVFSLQTDPYITAKLVAMSTSGRNMGKLVTTFSKPLTLTLSYADANQAVPDPAKVKVLWMENNVLLGVQAASADVAGKKLVTSLTHFTDYSPAVPGPCGDVGGQMGCDPGMN